MSKPDRCPAELELEAFCDERLPAGERHRVQAHLGGCPHCRAYLEQLDQTRQLLRRAAELPVPVLDEHRLRARVLEQAGSRRYGRRLPALAWAAAAAVLLLVALWWAGGSASPEDSVAPPAAGERQRLPARVQAEVQAQPRPVLVEWLSGTARGPQWQDGSWQLAAERQLELDAGSLASLWLDGRQQLLVAGPARLWVERRDTDSTIRLDSGNLLARLRRPLPGRFRVVHGALEIEATGTIFAVEPQAQGVLLEMLEGRVEFSWRQSASETGGAGAPQCLRLVPQGARPVACSGLGERLLQMAREGMAPGDGQGWLQVDSQPSGARVQIDGRAYGRVPLTVALAPGPHRLLLQSGEVQVPAEVEVRPLATTERLVRIAAPEPATPAPGPAHPEVAAAEERPPRLQQVRHLLAQRRFAAAEKLLVRLLQERPQDWRAWLLEADSLRLQGRVRQAEEIYLRVAEQAGEVTLAESAAYQRGLLLLGPLGQPRQAVAVFEHMLAAYPQGLLRQETLVHLVEGRLLIEDWPAALAAARCYLEEFPRGLKRGQMQQVVDRLQARHRPEE